MKELIRKFFRSLGLSVTKLSSPNPLTPQLHKTIRELRYVLENELDHLGDEKPREVELIARLDGTQPTEAYYIIDALRSVKGLEGDVCEMGVAQGFTSALIANEIIDGDKKLWLYDSFEGLPMPTEKDKLIDDIFNLGSIEQYHKTMKHSQDSVVSNLRFVDFPNERTAVVPGFIEDLDDEQKLPNMVSFAYLDFDFYEPIKLGLEKLHPKMNVGGKFVVDDYGFFSSGVKTAVDEFLQEHPGYEFTNPVKSAGKFCVLTKRSS